MKPEVSMVGEDLPEENYETLNKRIVALQKQIRDKQAEAARKVYEMRQLLRQEQIQLIKISDEMNRERKRNLAIQLTIDGSPCWVNKCEAECSGDLNQILDDDKVILKKIKHKRGHDTTC